MTAKDASGQRLFSYTEFLTGKQIASFFSRLAAKREEEDSNEDGTDDDLDPAGNEEVLSQLKNQVLEQVSLAHPIYFDRHNLCELTKKSKLLSLAIPVLQNICEEFDISTSDITTKKRKNFSLHK